MVSSHRMKYTPFLICVLFLFPAFARAAISPVSFEGAYVLTEARFGLLCFQELHGYIVSEDNGQLGLELGPWVFPHVNGGRFDWDDSLSKEHSESFTTDSKIVYRSVAYTKANQETARTYAEASLKGRILHIVSRNFTNSPGNRQGFETYHECVYRKVSPR